MAVPKFFLQDLKKRTKATFREKLKYRIAGYFGGH